MELYGKTEKSAASLLDLRLAEEGKWWARI